MKTFTATALFALIAGITQAAPAPAPELNDWVEVTFQGAPPDVAFFTMWVPTDGSVFPISMSFLPPPSAQKPR